jgi:hypothetical protein
MLMWKRIPEGGWISGHSIVGHLSKNPS